MISFKRSEYIARVWYTCGDTGPTLYILSTGDSAYEVVTGNVVTWRARHIRVADGHCCIVEGDGTLADASDDIRAKMAIAADGEPVDEVEVAGGLDALRVALQTRPWASIADIVDGPPAVVHDDARAVTPPVAYPSAGPRGVA